MKVRVKFKKEGPMKFIGHLDTMRYFQKALRRAGIATAFSEGFSPHMIMSFAYPLGVGTTSSGEYFDMEVKEASSSEDMKNRLNGVMAEGFSILSVLQIPDGKASSGMSLVAAADYQVTFRPGKEPVAGWKEKMQEFLSQDEIMILKKTKRSEEMTDIRPMIYQADILDDGVFLQLAAGSARNLKPELVMDAFYLFLQMEAEDFSFRVHRHELYADIGKGDCRKLVTLESLGRPMEE